MKKTNIHKLVFAAVLVALAVVGSLISFPIGASKCAPVQHLVNIIGAVFLGPAWAVGVGFTAAAITVYILPFFVSCAGGTVLAIVIVTALKKAKVFDNFLGFSKEVRA